MGNQTERRGKFGEGIIMFKLFKKKKRKLLNIRSAFRTKLLEELSELMYEIAKPKCTKRIAEEISDVEALLSFLIKEMKLKEEIIAAKTKKAKQYKRWESTYRVKK